MPDMLLIRKRPLKMCAERFAVSKPMPKNVNEYALLLEEFGEGLVSVHDHLLVAAEKAMLEMQSLSMFPIIMRREDVPHG